MHGFFCFVQIVDGNHLIFVSFQLAINSQSRFYGCANGVQCCRQVASDFMRVHKVVYGWSVNYLAFSLTSI